MGARNSTPTTVRIENPERGLAVQVTPSVVSRLVGSEAEAQKKNESSKYKENPNKKHQEDSYNWKKTQDPFQRRYLELESSHFEESFEKVKSLIGKPLAWDEDVNEKITILRHGLIKCYQEHPKQTLGCADLANQYQQFIFQEQFNAIQKFYEKNEEKEESKESKENEESEENKENEKSAESAESNLPSDFQ